MSASARILVVDDELELREMVSDYLSGHGYSVVTAANSAAARAIMRAQPADLAIVDVRMPGEDGISLARHLREHYAVAIVILTADGEVIDRIVGLEVGADDYLSKPFDPRELLARVKTILRRLGPSEAAERSGHRIQFGRCIVDLSQAVLIGPDGEVIPTSMQEFALLKVFLEHPNRVLSRDEILSLTNCRDLDAFDRSVDIRIARLRRKVETRGGKPQAIKTIRGAGYLFSKPLA